jgi:hypothetical protein
LTSNRVFRGMWNAPARRLAAAVAKSSASSSSLSHSSAGAPSALARLVRRSKLCTYQIPMRPSAYGPCPPVKEELKGIALAKLSLVPQLCRGTIGGRARARPALARLRAEAIERKRDRLGSRAPHVLHLEQALDVGGEDLCPKTRHHVLEMRGSPHLFEDASRGALLTECGANLLDGLGLLAELGNLAHCARSSSLRLWNRSMDAHAPFSPSAAARSRASASVSSSGPNSCL